MPLPIETPAPKASSLIKRFQQSIDTCDGSPLIPLPKLRLSQDPEEIAQKRKSWNVGSAGAPLPISKVVWNPPAATGQNNQLNHSVTGSDNQIILDQTSTQNTDHRTQSERDPTTNSPAHIGDSIENSTLNALLTPSNLDEDQAADLSKLADLSKSDLAVQTSELPVKVSSIPNANLSSSSASPEKRRTGVANNPARQSVSSRKPININHTAASLAKIRASETARSVSQPNPPISNSTKAKSSGRKTSTLANSPELNATGATSAAIRQNRSSSGPPKEPTRFMQNARPATPATTSAMRRQVISKTKAPPLPPFGAGPGLRRESPSHTATPKVNRRVLSTEPHKVAKPVQAESQTGSATTATDPSDKTSKKPVQRTRVASSATSASGTKKSPNLSSANPSPKTRLATAGASTKASELKSTRTKTQASPLHKGSPTENGKPPDVKQIRGKIQASSLKGSPAGKKTSKLPVVPFPDDASHPAGEKRNQQKLGKSSQGPTTEAVGDSKSDEHPVRESLEQGGQSDEQRDEAGPIVDQEVGPVVNRASGDEPTEEHDSNNQPSDEQDKPELKVSGPEALGAEKDLGAVIGVHVDQQPAGLVHEDNQPFIKHLKSSSRPPSIPDDEQSRPDLDASASTNTDGED